MNDLADLLSRAKSGDRAALAKLLTQLESDPDAKEQIKGSFNNDSDSIVIGLTGAPGVGKSTLSDALACLCASKDLPTAVLAIDPSSPITSGALLGDRIRMQQSSEYDNVFVRSFATRGHLGGTSDVIPVAVEVLKAVGKKVILIETVGVGQAEVEIASIAKPVVLVLGPEFGDITQASKAGVMEIADIFVINKADRPDAVVAQQSVKSALSSGAPEGTPVPPVLMTVATVGAGVKELWEQILALCPGDAAGVREAG